MASLTANLLEWHRGSQICEYIKRAKNVTLPMRLSLEAFMHSSHKFRKFFPVNETRMAELRKVYDHQHLADMINSAYPVVHERSLNLFAAFILFKRDNGTAVEKALYSNMSLIEFVDRLLSKRPYSFFGKSDKCFLRDDTRRNGGFEVIGTDSEREPLVLKEYLSYDEMKLSALLSVSSLSPFINNGNRENQGKKGGPGTFQEFGVIIGMVGARLKKPGYMEWQDCIVTKEQNTIEEGYGKADMDFNSLQSLWSCMWASNFPLWEGLRNNDENFMKIDSQTYLNVQVYKRRIQLTAEVLLAEAAKRSSKGDIKAYVHVVGLGLGVWRISQLQDQLYVEAFGDALKVVNCSRIGDVDFSWIDSESCHGTSNGGMFPNTNVTIHFSKRSPHDPVPRGRLLVVCYAWDGNSLPGNEYWMGRLASTGDGAAACSSGVTELHNVFINSNVSACNLHVAGPLGVLHIAEYAQKQMKKMAKEPISKKAEVSQTTDN